VVADWNDDAWRASALEWLRDELHLAGDDAVVEPEQFHVRPWSTVFRVWTHRGTVYLKAVPPKLAHEVRLTQWLSSRFPDRVAQVIAADDLRGLLLLRDGGARLRDVGTDLAGWCGVAGDYADLQLQASPGLTDLMELGVPDRRIANLPGALSRVLPATEGHLVARYTALCLALAEIEVPDTIQMDDLHDGNVLLDGGRTRFFDWGDASVAHPFFSLRMFLETAVTRLGVRADGREIARMRDTYLERFSGRAPMSVLRAAAVLASRVVPTVRIMSWQLAHAGAAPVDQRGQWGETLEELVQQQRAALA
jgi:hypothetical protein